MGCARAAPHHEEALRAGGRVLREHDPIARVRGAGADTRHAQREATHAVEPDPVMLHRGRRLTADKDRSGIEGLEPEEGLSRLRSGIDRAVVSGLGRDEEHSDGPLLGEHEAAGEPGLLACETHEDIAELAREALEVRLRPLRAALRRALRRVRPG